MVIHEQIVAIMKNLLLVFLVFLVVPLSSQDALAARAKVDTISKDPYVSALVIDADNGKVLFDDNGRAKVYPASVLKLMDLLVIMEQVKKGKLQLHEMVQVTDRAAKMGGSQVYLDPKEQFSVEDLLFALAVQSANDAAVALAIHVAGSVEKFVAMMNKKAEELGMKDTTFYSVHGLPPSLGQKPDETTAYDLALLSRDLARHPEIFTYTSMKNRDFRDGAFIMRNHNHLLGNVIGCDGFKTGYFRAAGFSIVATAQRDGARVIAIVMGSVDRKVRDAKASELIAKGFSLVEKKTGPQNSEPPSKKKSAAVEPVPEKPNDLTEKEIIQSSPQKNEDISPEPEGLAWGMFIAGVGVGIFVSGLLGVFIYKKRSGRRGNYRGYR
jgi:serine-type D-Ala-D-Ala carboxypeptidase (penicillin-binding protein 5/6)